MTQKNTQENCFYRSHKSPLLLLELIKKLGHSIPRKFIAIYKLTYNQVDFLEHVQQQ